MALAIKGSPGYSLVEFLVAMLILALVSLSWLTIAQVQSANRESYRREAVERLAGMMDVISSMKLTKNDVRSGKVAWRFDEGQPCKADLKVVNPLFNLTDSSIGYRIRVMKAKDNGLIVLGAEEEVQEADILGNSSVVLDGELFERSGTLDNEEYANAEKENVGERIWRVALVVGLK